MIKSMIFLILVAAVFIFVIVAKKYSRWIGKSIQNTAREMFVEEREKRTMGDCFDDEVEKAYKEKCLSKKEGKR